MRAEPRPGDVFAGHVIEREIGRGGMGIVLLARSIALDRRRAIKLVAPELSADPAFAARFRRESRLAASVEHPNVVGVHHAGEEDGLLYLVMSYVEGYDLGRLLADGPLEPERAARILGEAAAGLDAAHAAGLVHRDVKPANILIAAGGGREHVYLTDFGISKPVATSEAARATGATSTTALTGFGEILGTADYTAPEQIEDGRSDPRSDIYALACVAHHALTGAPPFARDSELATLIAHTKAARPAASAANPALPEAIDRPLCDGMAIEPETRPRSAGELADRIAAVLAGDPDPAPPRRRPTAAPAAPGTLRRPLAALAVLAVAALAVALAIVLTGGDDEPGPPVEPKPTVATSPPGDVGAGPTGVAIGDLRVWVASRDGDEVNRLRKGRPVEYAPPVPLAEPRQLAVGFNSIWAVNGDALYRLDPGEEGSKPLPIEVGAGPDDVAVDPKHVWVANEADGTVARVDPISNRVTGTVKVGEEPRAIATGKGAVYVASSGSGTVTKIDPETLATIGRPAHVGGRPTSLAVATRGVWVVDNNAATLRRLSPGRLQPEAPPMPVAARPRGVAVGLNSVWVASGGENVVERFDPRDGSPQGDPIPVGANPADVAVGTTAVYTANFGDASVTRISP